MTVAELIEILERNFRPEQEVRIAADMRYGRTSPIEDVSEDTNENTVDIYFGYFGAP